MTMTMTIACEVKLSGSDGEKGDDEVHTIMFNVSGGKAFE